MWRYYSSSFGSFDSGFVGLGLGLLFISLLVWSITWKGLALWKAAQQKDSGWFIAMLILNTMGILEIIYLYVISKKEKK